MQRPKRRAHRCPTRDTRRPDEGRSPRAATGRAARLFLVFLGDLGIMGTAIATQLPLNTLFFMTMINPLQLYRIASILIIQANLEVLGPAGLYATDQFGAALLPALLVGLAAWAVAPLIAALILFSRQEKFITKVARR